MDTPFGFEAAARPWSGLAGLPERAEPAQHGAEIVAAERGFRPFPG
ncbi:hypothetical protein [Roseicyclus amphidinii]|nr:hypothetical protein [Roseicyclus sp. Amp-Y-6]